ncbi:hypothetical protein SteCoe_19039 [Stentor coeruleus]|uniref:Uncharacterized protein n=1 Tax=Stentor coeruleus TaxID=5963 RepID=A0A1R2BV67_9CILI|nr:hypothetical protein SteCoe_19039 [Stentor coeruleus]
MFNDNKHGIGAFKPSFITVTKQSIYSKPFTAQHDTSTMVSAMRNSHFVLGEHSPAHRTVSQDTYSAKKLTEIITISPQAKKTSVSLGTNKSLWKTSNTLPGKFYVVEKADWPYKDSSVIMGFDSKKNMTTTQENFKQHLGNNINNLDPFVSEDIKKRHFTFGSTGVKYQPINKVYGKQQGPRQTFDDKALGYLKNVHYSFGNDEASMMSTTMSEFTYKQSPRSKPSVDLKSHSIVLGTFQNKWLTSKAIDARRTLS